MNIGLISHALAAACLFVLFLLLLTSWRGRLKGGLLVVAVSVNLLWAVVAACYAGDESRRWAVPYHVFEVARSVAWLTFL
ncbi:MAG: PEP-CTERM system histidine kinase PrsK, partial [Pseudomonadota bacterium]|nr:PEP-CTERM system histidine kinase PrsK [Pseudomonadota bacterium]